MNIYVNGSLIAEEQAVVSVYDHGFLYGIGLFETLRTYNGQPFLLKEHQDRLIAGCEQLGMDYQPGTGEWEGIIESLLKANGLEDAYFRFTVTAGEDILGLPAGEYCKPNLIVYVKGLPARDEKLYREGKPLQLLTLPRNTPEGSVRFKSLHYMNNILAKREMKRYLWAGGAEGLQTDKQGFLAEGIVSNLFFVKDGQLHTPTLDTGILPGITRAFVMDLAKQLGIAVEEGWYRWGDLQLADEAFITNSIQEIVPATTLYDPEGHSRMVGSGTSGPVTRRLVELYGQHTIIRK
ncbi:aminodeoxychorismate lyase [Paenibacillus sp. OAS669]|uniref:aminodeoxychorismate lyase n=1 Tax=Paenibacillus sp. OAS669 TaxID=2663821 RepID=UPI00178991D8|nr:aminodeoxychorismate lyase [Paenibacillus sp. OAS669]MBE1447208.1 4-amino-4-deoxychorismate lyase [Paenibacillus sp. OAS669]